MKKIAIIDDNKDQRETFKVLLSHFLKGKGSNLEVIDIFPFNDLNRYFSWIKEEDIIALIFDEKLHNDSTNGHDPVDYNGSYLVIRIRERLKDIPIFTLTNFPDDEDLQRNFNQFEYILSKSDFTEKHVDIILRASQRYLDENLKQLSQFDDLTRKIASGNGNDDDIETLKALTIKLHIPYDIDLQDREDWLREYEKQIIELEHIKRELESKIQ